jgi:NAD(P)-dependent dehydrogenase (short-subunit alcohol dehydrogenase family)
MKGKKIALVTGANKGIGFETARRLADLGYRVYLACRDQSKGKKAVDELHQFGLTDTFLLEVDVAVPSSVTEAVKTFSERESKLDVLINNAAIGGDQPQPASGIPLENLIAIFNTNFFGAVRITQALIPLLRNSTNARIVNVSSELGSLSFQHRDSTSYYARNLMGYSASKTALNAFTIMLNAELGSERFKINSVTPGLTSTDLTNNAGGHSAEHAASIIVQYAKIDDHGPSGEFFSQNGNVLW